MTSWHNTNYLHVISISPPRSRTVGTDEHSEYDAFKSTDIVSNSVRLPKRACSFSSMDSESHNAVPRKYGRLNKLRRSIYSTRHHVVELFGPQMPRAVIESLLYTSGAKTNSSININPECGWGWYVHGRKLLVWPVVPSFEKIPPTVIGRELQLPSSDLSHSANLVAVYVEHGSNAASCLAVTPEGLVRCWPTIGQYSSYFDVNTDLGGEEVCAVHYIPPLGCLAVTTTALMILLTPTINKGMPTVNIKLITVPQGWISGVSRRVSSIIFGVLPPAQGLESKVVKVLTKRHSLNSWHIFLLSGLTLQSWIISKDAPHEMCFECDLTRMINSAFKDSPSDDSELVIQDMRYSEAGLFFLAVSSSPRNYMIVEIIVRNVKTAPTECSRLCTLTQQDILTVEGTSGKISNLQFLPLTTSAFVFNNKVILSVQLTKNQAGADRLDIPGGLVMGGHMYDKVPVFFSATHGFVSVTPTDASCMDMINSSLADIVIEKSSSEIDEGATSYFDCVTSLKTAFIYYVRKNVNMGKALISREFPPSSDSPIDSTLATTLVKVSLDIINDASSKDPRWGDTKKSVHLPGAVSLQLENQLLEKLHAHDMFLEFAKDVSLSQDLGKVSSKNGSSPIKTMLVLYEHNEKITAAIRVRNLQKEHPEIVNTLMEMTCKQHNFTPSMDISYQDYFFRHICFIDDGLRALSTHCEELMATLALYPRNIEVIKNTNIIFVDVCYAIMDRRVEIGRDFSDPSYVPWLSASGPYGLFDYLMKQRNATLSIIVDYVKDSTTLFQLKKQLLSLSDTILNSQRHYTGKFFQLRSDIIRQFFKINELKIAISLSEKFKDFEILIEICFKLNDVDRLIRYVDQYSSDDFCDATFEWCLREKKIPQLLTLPWPSKYVSKLTKFLEKYPKVAWVHTVRNEDFKRSQDILTKIGFETSKFALRKERSLALAKLATYVNGKVSNIKNGVNKQLQVLRLQRRLSTSVLQKYGFEKSTARAFSTIELIELFTDEDNKDAKCEEFIIAFDLLKYLDNDEIVMKVRNDIWVRAIKRDKWNFPEGTSPVDAVNHAFIFNLMSFVATLNNYESLLPTLEEILSHDELQYLSNNTFFKYIMTYGFEMFEGITMPNVPSPISS